MSIEDICPERTYEGIVEELIAMLQRAGVVLDLSASMPWDAFLRLSDLVHKTYEVPSTTLTPIMRRLLFALSLAARPSNVVGIGTYVGYAFTWLLRHREDPEASPFVETATGIDVDARVNTIARRNCAVLAHGDRLRFVDSDAVVAIERSDMAIDLLYLDLDDRVLGKSGYRRVLEVAHPHLTAHAIILAHDPCVKKFEQDFETYHSYVRDSGLFSGPWILPVDSCGLSVTVAL